MAMTIKQVTHRAVTVKMALEIMRLFCAAYFRDNLYGSRASDFIVAGAVFVGQAEGRPLNASKVADFAGMPRPTVVRKLAELEAEGIVAKNGRTFTIPGELANSEDAVAAASAAKKQIVDAATKLSKLDTVPVAKHTSWAVVLSQMIFG